jgi:hypothetical protein
VSEQMIDDKELKVIGALFEVLKPLNTHRERNRAVSYVLERLMEAADSALRVRAEDVLKQQQGGVPVASGMAAGKIIYRGIA